MEENNNPRTESLSDEQRVFQTSLGSNAERTDAASGHQTRTSRNTDSQSQNSRKRKLSGCSGDPGVESFLATAHLLEGWGRFHRGAFYDRVFQHFDPPPPPPSSLDFSVLLDPNGIDTFLGGVVFASRHRNQAQLPGPE